MLFSCTTTTKQHCLLIGLRLPTPAAVNEKGKIPPRNQDENMDFAGPAREIFCTIYQNNMHIMGTLILSIPVQAGVSVCFLIGLEFIS